MREIGFRFPGELGSGILSLGPEKSLARRPVQTTWLGPSGDCRKSCRALRSWVLPPPNPCGTEQVLHVAGEFSACPRQIFYNCSSIDASRGRNTTAVSELLRASCHWWGSSCLLNGCISVASWVSSAGMCHRQERTHVGMSCRCRFVS